MLNHTDCFSKLIATHACICFTATPDNSDALGVEAKIIAALKFKKYNYILDI